MTLLSQQERDFILRIEGHLVSMPLDDDEYKGATDEQLVAWIKNGTETQRGNAFHEIYNRTSKKSFAIIKKRVVSIEESQDLFQEAWAEIIRKMPTKAYTYTGDPIANWVYKISSTICLPHFSELKKEDELTQEMIQELVYDQLKELFQSEGAMQDVSLPSPVKQKLKRLILEATKGLTRYQKKLIILRYYQGLSLQDIANKLDKKPGAIRKAFTDIFKKLKKLLGGYYED